MSQVTVESLGCSERSPVESCCKKVKVAHTRLPNVGFQSWSQFFAAPCRLGGGVEQAHLVSWLCVVIGNWTRIVLFCCISGCLLFLICIVFVYLYFPVGLLFCLSVSVKWLAVKTASEMTYTVSGEALNSTQTKPSQMPRLYGPEL